MSEYFKPVFCRSFGIHFPATIDSNRTTTQNTAAATRVDLEIGISDHTSDDVSFVLPPPRQPLKPVNSTPERRAELTTSFLAQHRSKSCSRQNFAANLVRALYSHEERKESNVAGKLGKKQLNKGTMTDIRAAVFQIYPLGVGEREEKAWSACITAIDESCRRLNRASLKKEN